MSTIQFINTGTGPNSGNGDSLRAAFHKINTNFSILSNSAGTLVSGICAGPGVYVSTATTISGALLVGLNPISTLTNNGWDVTLSACGALVYPDGTRQHTAWTGTVSYSNITGTPESEMLPTTSTAGYLYNNGICTVSWQSVQVSSLNNGLYSATLSSSGGLILPAGVNTFGPFPVSYGTYTGGTVTIGINSGNYSIVAYGGGNYVGTTTFTISGTALGGTNPSNNLNMIVGNTHAGIGPLNFAQVYSGCAVCLPNGYIEFPDGSQQTTAWTGTVSYNNITGVPALIAASTSSLVNNGYSANLNAQGVFNVGGMQIGQMASSGEVTSVVICNPGTSYMASGKVHARGGNGGSLIINYTAVAGVVQTVSVFNSGAGYQLNDVVTLQGGAGNATVKITGVSNTGLIGSLVFPDGSVQVTAYTGKTACGLGGTGPSGPSGPAGNTISVSTTPPCSPACGQLWYDDNTGRTYLYYSGSWVDANPAIAGGSGGGCGCGATSHVVLSACAPCSPASGQLWYDEVGGRTYIYYGGDWVDASPAVAGAQGPSGPSGAAGANGTSVTIKGSVAHATTSQFTAISSPGFGDGYIAVDTGNLWVYAAGPSYGGFDNVGRIVGPSGASGPTGPQGLEGPSGPHGASGAASTVSGPSGPAGANGASGPSGPTGAASTVSGPTGASGPSGPSGASGVAGVNGVSGPSGPSGRIGLDGVTGPSGPTGVSGVGVTGPTGVSGVGAAASFARYTRTAAQTTNLVTNGIVIFNVLENAYGSDIAVNTTTGQITLAAGRTYRVVGMIPTYTATSSAARPQFMWWNETTSAWIGSSSAAYSVNDGAGYGSFGGPAETIITTTVPTTLSFRILSMTAGSISGLGHNTDFSTVGDYPWMDIQVIAGQAPITGLNNYIQVYQSTNVANLTTNSVIGFDTVVSNSGITYNASNGYFTLAAGLTYELYANINWLGFSDTVNGWISYQWVDATTGTPILPNNSTLGIAEPISRNTNESIQTAVKAIYTPSATQTVKLMITGATGTATQRGVFGTYAIIKQIAGNTLAGNVVLGAGAVSTSTNTGGVVVNGGLGVGGSANIGGAVLVGNYSQVPGLYSALGVKYVGTGTQYGLALQSAGDNTTAVSFINAAGTGIGSITQTNSTVTFNGNVGTGFNVPTKVAAFVNAGTFVSMDNIKVTVTTTGYRGLSIAAVSTTFTADIGGTYGLNGGGGGSSAYNVTYTTTPASSAFGWGFPGAGDISTYHIHDTTNARAYRITLQIGAGYNNNMISIERLI